MPDIQTEMHKLIQSWDRSEQEEVLKLCQQLEELETIETTKEETVFKPTNNVTKSTFNSVRDNPGLPKKEYIRKLEALGFKKASTSSLLSQMVRQGHIWAGSDGALRPNGTEYTPLKTSKSVAKQAKKPKTLKVKTSNTEAKGLAALVNEPMAAALKHQPDIRTSIDVIMDTVSLNDAHELYRRLHLYFGGLGK
jgi:hypothetical protein